MNRYLLAGFAVVCIGAEASENPFDLKNNLQNLDADQSALLSELRKSAKNDDALMVMPAKEVKKELPPTVPMAVSKETSLTPTEVNMPEKNATSKLAQTPETIDEDLKTVEQFEAQKAQTKAASPQVEISENSAEDLKIVEQYEAQKKNVAPQQSKSIDIPPKKEEQVVAKPQYKEKAMTQEEIQKLYLEAVKEVGGK